MLVARIADAPRVVVHRTLVLAAFVCCTLVLASFALFARDQLARASAHQQSELVATAPAGRGTPGTAHGHEQPRRFIDGAARALTSPFDAIVHSDSQWVRRGLPTLLALLAYGVGLGYLARYSSGLS
jgi:hypothetical protein